MVLRSEKGLGLLGAGYEATNLKEKMAEQHFEERQERYIFFVYRFDKLRSSLRCIQKIEYSNVPYF